MRPIGVFDSGVGGLGIFKAIAEKLPNQDLVYAADNANLPFGLKTPEQLNVISEKIVQFLIDKHDVQMVVIACNTATVASLDYLRSKFSVPIVGAVPVIKPACQQSKNKRVAILATPTTAASTYVQGLIADFAGDVDVLVIPCPGLADLVDTGDLDSPQLLEALQGFLAPAIAHGADVIGLGCTQYPFLKPQIAALLPPYVMLLDSNQPVALQVQRLMVTQPPAADDTHQPRYIFYATQEASEFCRVAQKLVGSIIQVCQLVMLK